MSNIDLDQSASGLIKEARFHRITDAIKSSSVLVEEIGRLNLTLIAHGAPEEELTEEQICIGNFKSNLKIKQYESDPIIK